MRIYDLTILMLLYHCDEYNPVQQGFRIHTIRRYQKG